MWLASVSAPFVFPFPIELSWNLCQKSSDTVCAALFLDQFCLFGLYVNPLVRFSPVRPADVSRISLFWQPRFITCWALPGKCNYCHLLPRAVRATSLGAGALALSVSLSSGHWHRDDTGRVGVQPGNNRQVGVKGKPPTAPLSLSWKSSSHWRGWWVPALWTSPSVGMFSGASSVLALWEHRVTWFHCAVTGTSEEVSVTL